MYVLLTFRVGIINKAGVDSIVICDVPAIIANRVGFSTVFKGSGTGGLTGRTVHHAFRKIPYLNHSIIQQRPISSCDC
jgi:hypothetical protein